MATCNVTAPANACIACAQDVYQCGDLLVPNACQIGRTRWSVCYGDDCGPVEVINPYSEDPCPNCSGECP